MSGPDRDDLDCQDVVELVTGYLDGALHPQLHDRVRVHLTGCDGCEAYVDQVRRTVTALGTLPPAPVDARMRERLLAAFRDRAGGRGGP